MKNNKKLLAQNPLIDSSGQKIVPNVTRVFRPGQNLHVYLEVYDPARPENLPANVRADQRDRRPGAVPGRPKVLETAAGAGEPARRQARRHDSAQSEAADSQT